MTNTGEPAPTLGDFATIPKSPRNTKGLPRPKRYLDSVHMDIGYGDCIGIGGFRYVLVLVDRCTRYCWVYGLTSITGASIVSALEEFALDAGSLPRCLYTDFDKRLIAGSARKWLATKQCRVVAAPSNRQNQNGLVERNWRTMVQMA
jgi:transposase InsO family protein